MKGRTALAKDLRDRQLIELKDTIKEQSNKIDSLISLLEAANKREEEHIKREKVLQEQIDFLTKKLFGKSSEKRNNDIEGQLNLFNEAEAEQTDSIRPRKNSLPSGSIPVRRNPPMKISLAIFL